MSSYEVKEQILGLPEKKEGNMIRHIRELATCWDCGRDFTRIRVSTSHGSDWVETTCPSCRMALDMAYRKQALRKALDAWKKTIAQHRSALTKIRKGKMKAEDVREVKR